MGTKQYIQITLRILLLTITGIVIFYSYQNQLTITIIGVSLLFAFQFYLLVFYIKQQFLDIEKSIDCLLYDDYSNVLSAEKRKNPLHNKTALLHRKYKDSNLEKSSEQLIFTNIIESLTIGILILKKDENQNIEIYKINKAFTDFLKIPKYHHWDLLQQQIQPLIAVLDMDNWKTLKHVISLNINDEEENFFLKTSITNTYGYDYMVITLETIQQLIDKKEKESWYKLMNVMSHEIINTITPISSLAGSLESLLLEEPESDETIQELTKGLGIINKRSEHLTEFVNTYRKLTELPLPQKESVNLIKLVQQVLELFASKFTENQVQIVFDAEKAQHVNVDKNQIEQVLINLVSNSLNSFQDIENPTITIDVTADSFRTHLKVTDNGIGIQEDIQDKIFIPYFTTRKNGSGIGLTLSKSIMEAHGGSINFSSKNGNTSFVLVFVEHVR
tara:strand:- start:1876 stop:3213 length:1338 start_codon:yes stop_codon:yes gene_type:complete